MASEKKPTGTGGVRFPNVKVRLTGTDGNVFAIIGTVSRAMKRAGLRDEAAEFCDAAFAARSYDEVLRLCMTTVDVS